MDKKYKYCVCLSAEEDCIGTIELTKKEAEIVAYAVDRSNWKDVEGGGWCGSFIIDVDNPIELEE